EQLPGTLGMTEPLGQQRGELRNRGAIARLVARVTHSIETRLIQLREVHPPLFGSQQTLERSLCPAMSGLFGEQLAVALDGIHGVMKAVLGELGQLFQCEYALLPLGDLELTFEQ